MSLQTSPRQANETAMRLVEAAARLLADEGTSAVTARRVSAEAGVSTMAVYTHFGSMDELLAAIGREGFARFSVALEAPAATADPVADWMAQGWAYRHFARSEPHLYRVMFSTGQAAGASPPPEDAAAAAETFHSLLRVLERCEEAGRFALDDLHVAGEVVWAAVHGHVGIELAGCHGGPTLDPIASYCQGMVCLAIGFGDDPDAARRSLATARRRARRAGQDA